MSEINKVEPLKPEKGSMDRRITTIYVSKDVKSEKTPHFTTIQEALDYVVHLRKSGVLQPVSVRLCDAEYELETPIEIHEDCSDVTIEPNVSGETVLISGGKRICGFQKTTFQGVECFGAYIPEVERGEWEFTDLYVDGLRADYTRYPETGDLEILDYENHKGDLFDGSKWITVNKEDMKPLMEQGLDGAILSFCHFWIDEHTPIESYDEATGRLELEYCSRFTFDTLPTRYYIENIAYGFSKPNQWFLDRNKGMLYYIPRSGAQTSEDVAVYAPVVSQFLNIIGTKEQKVRGVRIRGLDFAYTRGDYRSNRNEDGLLQDRDYASDPQAVANAFGTISFQYAHGCSLENCVIRNFGLHGINITEGCDRVTVSGCDVLDGGAGGIRVNGGDAKSDPVDITENNLITNNIIQSCGRRYMAACGILTMHSRGNIISHNEVSQLYYTGISCGWVWGYEDSVSRDNLITKNYIHHLGRGMLSDMGGVYLLGQQPGTIVSNNVIHDITSQHYGGWALYTDQGSSFITLENNICYRTSDNIYHHHFGAMNTVRNNIFAFSGRAMLDFEKYEPHISMLFERNILMSSGGPIYRCKEEQFKEQTFVSESNLYITKDGSGPLFIPNMADTIADMRKNGMDLSSVIADNCFADVDNDDFTVDMNHAGVKAIGFQEINCSDVGVMR